MLSVPWWKIKKLRPEAKLPVKANPGDAGWDLFYCPEEGRTTPEVIQVGKSRVLVLPTGLSMAFPPEWAFVIFGRSGLAKKHLWKSLAGVIDSGYRGDVVVLMETPYKVLPKGRRRVTLNTQTPEYEIEYPYIPQPGDKIAQGLFIPNPTVAPTEVQELPGSERGTGGFGSTDEALKAAIEDPLVIFQALVQHSCPGAGLPAEDGNVCPDCGMTVGRTSEGKLCFHPRKA